MSANRERYVCNLPPEVLAKAVSELHEPEENEKRLTAIDELRNNFIRRSDGEALINDDDAFLLRFLRARKFDMHRSVAMLQNYHKQRAGWPEVFDKVNNPLMLEEVFDDGCVCGSVGRARDGSAIVIGRPGKLSRAKVVDFFSGMFLTVEKLLEDEQNQVHGITVIHDMSNLSFGFVRQIGPTMASRFLGILQDCIPLRLKSINILNEPFVFDIAFAIIGPFMKEKTKKRLTIHGSEFCALQNIVDPDVLPKEYGGSGNDIDTLAWKNEVINQTT